MEKISILGALFGLFLNTQPAEIPVEAVQSSASYAKVLSQSDLETLYDNIDTGEKQAFLFGYLSKHAPARRNHYALFQKAIAPLIMDGKSADYRAFLAEKALQVAEQAYQNGVIGRLELVDEMMNSAWYHLERNTPESFKRAEALSRKGMDLAPNHVGVVTNLVHALALQGRTDEALHFYHIHADEKIYFPDYDTEFSAEMTRDFNRLKEMGVWNTQMDEFIKRLNQP